MMTTHFQYRPEAGQNPNTGFVSFQHFNGGALYSDIVVRPENRYTETENVECYPVPDYVPQNGRAEGYYPASSVAYIRVLWKEFEATEGVYNYAFIENILRLAREHGQTVAFRLMAHSTRACDDVPDWLKAKISCPERPDGMRVKDSPKDPLFITLFSRAVRKLGERFDADPRLSSVDLTVPGAWGEGHQLDEFPREAILEMTDAYLDTFTQTQLIGQISLPDIISYARTRRNVGVRGDGYGEPRHMQEFYPPRFQLLSDVWKTAPISFESYWWLGEWERKGWDIDEAIARSLDWHLSSFNAKSIPIPYKWQEKIDAWVARMGYHLSPVSFTFPERVTDERMRAELVIENRGVAPCYETLPLVLRLKNERRCYDLPTSADIRTWLPGIHTVLLDQDVSGIEAGAYKLELGIVHPLLPVFLATDAPSDDGFYVLGETVVERT
ncbi:MAG: DUF4832 domain-containing protein [Eubacteriales bacterium]|jgi:hypothetical protein